MILRDAYIRFFRAFNHDYLRRIHPEAKQQKWDMVDDKDFYPYIRLKVDPQLTTVVGANESGKSQLLQAIKCALGVSKLTPADFCRYSDYFTVTKEMELPHLGLHFDQLTDDEIATLSGLIGGEVLEDSSSFRFFRSKPETISIFVGKQVYEIPDSTEFSTLLPDVFPIDPNRALPDSVPISFLTREVNNGEGRTTLTRDQRLRLFDGSNEILSHSNNASNEANVAIQNVTTKPERYQG